MDGDVYPGNAGNFVIVSIHKVNQQNAIPHDLKASYQ